MQNTKYFTKKDIFRLQLIQILLGWRLLTVLKVFRILPFIFAASAAAPAAQ